MFCKLPVKKKNTKPFQVTYHSAADIRPTPQEGVLEERWLHQLFLITHLPANWSAWRLFGGVLSLTSLVWLMWRPFGAVAQRLAALYHIFTLLDWLLLWWLPKSGRSFGPIGAQLFVLNTPRLGAAAISAMISRLNLTLGKLTFIILQLVGTLGYFWGAVVEPFNLTLTRLPLFTPKIPPKGRRIRLLHISDLHVERLTRREADLLAQIDYIRPDMIVITGDYLNLSYVNEPVARAEVRRLLGQLSAPYGVYAILGSPPADPRATTPSLFDGTNIRLLRDEVAVLEFVDGQKVSLIGLDCEHDLAADFLVFQKLHNLSPADSVRILLYHSPELMPQVQNYPLELYLCGHTHGGQVRLPGYGALLTSSSLGKQYEMGLYHEQDTMMYISRGIGLEGLSAPRLRFLCHPEIILFTLLPEEHA